MSNSWAQILKNGKSDYIPGLHMHTLTILFSIQTQVIQSDHAKISLSLGLIYQTVGKKSGHSTSSLSRYKR